MLYARQKGLAENFLRERMTDGRLAIVVLRPGLIWGPGSPWVLTPARDMVGGVAYLVGDGGGICNLMYVDNLVRSIDAVVAHPAPASGFYNVSDDETTTWRKYYGALAAGLGVDMSSVPTVSADRYRTSVRDHLEWVQTLATYKWLKARVSLESRTAIKGQVSRLVADGGAATRSTKRRPVVTRPLWHLQTTRHTLPTERFRATFGHHNQTSFASGVAASLAWLRFIGLAEAAVVERVVGSTTFPAFERQAGLSLTPSLSRQARTDQAQLPQHGDTHG
jgi:nucleoside-diphosphate-sugar epimerase